MENPYVAFTLECEPLRSTRLNNRNWSWDFSGISRWDMSLCFLIRFVTLRSDVPLAICYDIIARLDEIRYDWIRPTRSTTNSWFTIYPRRPNTFRYVNQALTRSVAIGSENLHDIDGRWSWLEPRLDPTAEVKSLNAYRLFIEALQD